MFLVTNENMGICLYMLSPQCTICRNPQADHGLRLPGLPGWVEFSLPQRPQSETFYPVPIKTKQKLEIFQVFGINDSLYANSLINRSKLLT